MIDWHRLFGLVLTDFFTFTSFEVELEKDLSIQKQMLDVVILRKGDEKTDITLPDGLAPLANHNLITYKSLRETLDDWVLDELVSYYVNYRKQTTANKKLLPVTDFHLYAVSTRIPKKLQEDYTLTPLRQGVYQIRWGSRNIRIIVLNEMPEATHNALWNLFSSDQTRIIYGAENYQLRTEDMNTLLNNLLQRHAKEGTIMPYTMEDFKRDAFREYLSSLTPREFLENVTTVLKQDTKEGFSQEVLELLFDTHILNQDNFEKGLATLFHKKMLNQVQLQNYLQKLAEHRPPDEDDIEK